MIPVVNRLVWYLRQGRLRDETWEICMSLALTTMALGSCNGMLKKTLNYACIVVHVSSPAIKGS